MIDFSCFSIIKPCKSGDYCIIAVPGLSEMFQTLSDGLIVAVAI